MSGVRGYVLETQFHRVASGMELRQPQRDSLRVVHSLVTGLSRPPAQVSERDVIKTARGINPEWTFPRGHAELTFALATGVGKTRLMGAIMAYLYRSGESKNFVLLAPRDAILRKLEDETREASPKYIFVDRGLVPQPRTCHRGNLLDFDPRPGSEGLLPTGPNLFILSPQLLLTEGRIAQPSPHLGFSILEFLRACEDLVVFVDESHHLSPAGLEEDATTWARAIQKLGPKLVCAMTATPREGADVAYTYDLRRCLRDRLYTKSVRLIVDDRASTVTDDEYDRITLDAALERLVAKKHAIVELRARMPAFPDIEPVLLVAAQDTEHANRVYRALLDRGAVSEEEILLIHSRKKTDRDMDLLSQIDTAGNRVRVVVQVHVLDEGWDVTNVYVVAPLRNVNSYTNARQIMGRGLRLPAGVRVDDAEVDTLDVLAFGQETFEDVYEQATREFGPGGGIVIDRAGALSPGVRDSDVLKDGDAPEGQYKSIEIPVGTAWEFTCPRLDMIPPEPSLDVNLATGIMQGPSWKVVDLSTLETDSITGQFVLPRDRFVRITVDNVLREFEALSAPTHAGAVTRLVETLIEPWRDAATLSADPLLVSKLIVDALLERYFAAVPAYQPTGDVDTVRALPLSVWVPETFQQPIALENVHDWSQREHHRLPIAGWSRCSHAAARFDTEPEFAMAVRLDRMVGVRLWLRNDPAHLRVETIARDSRTTGADFIVSVEEDSRERILLLEVKGEHLWERPLSESRVRARDVALWAAAANSALGDERFVPIVVLGGDVGDVASVADLRDANAWPDG